MVYLNPFHFILLLFYLNLSPVACDCSKRIWHRMCTVWRKKKHISLFSLSLSLFLAISISISLFVPLSDYCSLCTDFKVEQANPLCGLPCMAFTDMERAFSLRTWVGWMVVREIEKKKVHMLLEKAQTLYWPLEADVFCLYRNNVIIRNENVLSEICPCDLLEMSNLLSLLCKRWLLCEWVGTLEYCRVLFVCFLLWMVAEEYEQH